MPACWICGGTDLRAVHGAVFELGQYREQDPDLAEYSGAHVDIVRCARCGFAQPAALPALPGYFDRMYDQRWADDWIVNEHEAAWKDRIFDTILAELTRRAGDGRRLLDVGAHAGRFIARARTAGWDADGLELNPKTAAFAAKASGGRVYQANVYSFVPDGPLYDAITLTDVLEHIPDPRAALRRVHGLLRPGGQVAVKVPSGPSQRIKERVRGWLRPSYRPTLADNLVHVNHFGPRSLRLALEREGFQDVRVVAAAPELVDGGGAMRMADRLVRVGLYRLAQLPGALRTPVALNLQAYGRRP